MSLDKTLKAIGLRKKTPADKVREAGASLNARFAKLRGATPESRARAAGARFGLDRRPVILAALWAFAALPWFDARWTGSVTPAGLAPLVLGQALSMQDKIAESFTGLLGSKLWEQADGVRSVAGVAAFGQYALPMAVCLVAYYVTVLAMTMRSWSRPVEKFARDVLRPIVGDLPAFYKVTTALAAGGALAALAILLLTQTRPGPGAVGGAAAGAWAFLCADRLDALDRAEAKKSA